MRIKDDTEIMIYMCLAWFTAMILIGIGAAGHVKKKMDLSTCNVTTIAVMTDKSFYDYDWVGRYGGVVQHKTSTTITYTVIMEDGSEKYIYVTYPFESYRDEEDPNVLDVCYNSQDYSMFFVDVAPIFGREKRSWYKDTRFKVY